MNKTNSNFTSNWIGKCPVKGCACRIHIDIPMIRERWEETHHDHAHGQRWQVQKSISFAANFGHDFSPRQFGLACAIHRRDLNWTPINGVFSEAHVCDSRCMNATGPNCECSCGGANHARGHHVELLFA